MKVSDLKLKSVFLYPAIGLIVLSLGVALTLAAAAQNLNSFEFLKYAAFVSISGMLTFGTSFSLEHQTTKSLASESSKSNIAFLSLLLSPIKRAASVSVLMVVSVLTLERLNKSGIYANLYLPLLISIGLTFAFSGLRGWAASLRSPVYLANSNFIAGISTFTIPLVMLTQTSAMAAYVWGFTFSPMPSIFYLGMQLHRHNRRPEFYSVEKAVAANIDGKLTWAYQGLTIAYLGSTLVLSNVHSAGEEAVATQAQLYLASAKAVPQLLLGIISIALAFMARENSKNSLSRTRSWALSTLLISSVVAAAAFFVMPRIILYLTGSPVTLDRKLIALIYISMILMSLSLVCIPKFIFGGTYKYLGIIWWTSALTIAIGFTPMVSNGISAGVLIILISSLVSLLLSAAFLINLGNYSSTAESSSSNNLLKVTTDFQYTNRLVKLESKSWKRILNVQAPYRWNLKRLDLGRTLDIGCGLGRNLRNLPDGIGVDHNSESIEIARSNGLKAYTTVEWETCADAKSSSFDSMLLAHVLEHLTEADSDKLIESYLPYLKSNGKLVVICPQERGFPSDPTHIRWVNSKILADTGSKHGFSKLKSYSFPFPRLFGRVFKYNEFVYVGIRM